MKKSREKTERFELRMTITEKEKLLAKAKEANMNMSQYIIALSENKKIVVAENIPQLLVEITRIGTNINQIAHVCNSQKYVQTEQLTEINRLMQDVKSAMNKILHELFLDNQEVEPKTLDKKLNLILSLLTEEKHTERS